MIRAALLVALLQTVLQAAPTTTLVTGEELAGVRLMSATGATAKLHGPDGWRTVPTTTLASAAFDANAGEAETGEPINLYLENGDRLRGTVTGAGQSLHFNGIHLKKLVVPLARVRAVRFGRLMGGLQHKYSRVFERELERGRDVVVIQRDTRPFPIYARVLSVDAGTITVRVGQKKREIESKRVYGFVQQVERREPVERISLRAHLGAGARVTLPLESIDEDVIRTGETSISLTTVQRIEFLGGHIAHLSDFEPIDVSERALFGEAPRWRRNAMVLGGPLRLDDREWSHGLGVAAYARLEYVLGGRWSSLFVRCGIDDRAGREGAASFRILGDGKLLRELTCRRGERSVPVLLDVSGIDRLVLESDPGESYTSDFCDWVEARVFNTQPEDKEGDSR